MGKALVGVRRFNDGDWRTNVAQGGRVEAAGVPDPVTELAVDAAAALGCEFAGVDIVRDTNGGHWILEVNAVPGWRAVAAATGVDVAAACVASLNLEPSRVLGTLKR